MLMVKQLEDALSTGFDVGARLGGFDVGVELGILVGVGVVGVGVGFVDGGELGVSVGASVSSVNTWIGGISVDDEEVVVAAAAVAASPKHADW